MTFRRMQLAGLALWVVLVLPRGASAQTDERSAEAAPASVGKKKKRKLKRRTARTDGFQVELRAAAQAGGFRGYGVRKGDAAVASLAAEIEPRFIAGDLSLAAPLDAGHRQTFGMHLPETRAKGGFEVGYRIAAALRVAAEAAVGLVERPNWPDLYQPIDSTYEPTDRYSYWTRSIGAGITLHPVRRNWVRGSYAYRLDDYAVDPHFDAVLRPNHLTPFDSEKHTAKLDYTYTTPRFRLEVGARGFVSNSFFVFARDARTGFTHAGPGGRPANSLQSIRGISPEVGLTLKLPRQHLRVSLGYAHEFQQDTFQGYYSSSGPNPSLDVQARIRPVSLHASAELNWRSYGDGSYRQGIGHPPLDSGDRRFDHRVRVALGARLSLSKLFALTLASDCVVRNTNFPDYQPGVFPQAQRYSIDWDYTNVSVLAGVEFRERIEPAP